MTGYSREDILTAVQEHRPDVAADAAIRRCATGKFNTTFFIEGGDAPPLVIRIAPPEGTGVLFYERNMMAQEPELHALLFERTDVPVARIHAYDTSHRILDSDFLLMERLPGTSLTEAVSLGSRRVEEVFGQVGEHLARVHALHVETYGYRGAHHPMEPQSTWQAAFHVMWNKIIDDTKGCGGYSDEEADTLRRLLDRFLPLFEYDKPASLLHMDIWHQNILVTPDGHVSGIVDWDRALWGDPEIEFAVLDYCGVSVPAFWDGYGRLRDNSEPARIRQRFYMLYEVQKYILISLLRRRDPASAERYRQHVFSLAAGLY